MGSRIVSSCGALAAAEGDRVALGSGAWHTGHLDFDATRIARHCGQVFIKIACGRFDRREMTSVNASDAPRSMLNKFVS
jgi:hypothetical protein